ncbi:MAG: hypothetical protein JW793_05465 [Acidobacteria bacterium]|nr:hypothetical protein [Acidobacteriota bacterium]
MESGKYGHCIKPLRTGATSREDARKAPGGLGALLAGPGNANREIRLNGRDRLEGLNLSFSWGVHTGLGDWHSGLDPHTHPYPECLLFAGLDTANIKYLGAEISCCLGPELETYTFNEPTAIIIPAGLPHGPIATKRMYSPIGFGFWAVELSAVTETTWMGEGVSKLSGEQLKNVPGGMRFAPEAEILKNKPVESTGKYARLVKPLKSFVLVERGKVNPDGLARILAGRPEEKSGSGGQPGPGSPDHLAWMCGSDLEGLDANILWGFCSRPGIARRGAGAHVHRTDEVLVYLGMDPENPDSLGAEIEVDLGKEHERHLIDKPSAIVCPSGTPHTPLVTRWVDRPFAFFAVTLSGTHEAEVID